MKTILIFFLISLVAVCNGGELRKNFYEETCPDAEYIVQSIIWKNVARNSTLPAKFLRMHFHDCFVRVMILRTYRYSYIINYQCLVLFQHICMHVFATSKYEFSVNERCLNLYIKNADVLFAGLRWVSVDRLYSRQQRREGCDSELIPWRI